jgi:hypothetical protein
MSKNEFKVGDIIRAYHKGFHRIVDIEKRSIGKDKTDSPLLTYERILDSKMSPAKGRKKNRCDAEWCVKVEREQIVKEMTDQIEHFKRGYELLLKELN